MTKEKRIQLAGMIMFAALFARTESDTVLMLAALGLLSCALMFGLGE